MTDISFLFSLIGRMSNISLIFGVRYIGLGVRLVLWPLTPRRPRAIKSASREERVTQKVRQGTRSHLEERKKTGFFSVSVYFFFFSVSYGHSKNASYATLRQQKNGQRLL